MVPTVTRVEQRMNFFIKPYFRKTRGANYKHAHTHTQTYIATYTHNILNYTDSVHLNYAFS